MSSRRNTTDWSTQLMTDVLLKGGPPSGPLHDDTKPLRNGCGQPQPAPFPDLHRHIIRPISSKPSSTTGVYWSVTRIEWEKWTKLFLTSSLGDHLMQSWELSCRLGPNRINSSNNYYIAGICPGISKGLERWQISLFPLSVRVNLAWKGG